MGAVITTPPVLSVRSRSKQARASLEAAAGALRRQDPAGARADLDAADAQLRASRRLLRSPILLPARVVPVVSRQLKALDGLTLAGRLSVQAAEAAAVAVEARPAGGWRVSGGGIDLGATGRAAQALKQAVAPARRAEVALRRTPSTWLAPPLAEARADALRRVRSSRVQAERGSAGLDLLGTLLGRDGRRRYVVAFSNLAELRGTGGLLGYFAVLETSGGKLGLLAGSGRPDRELPTPRAAGVRVPDWYRDSYEPYAATAIWQNVNLTSDFPTVARIVSQGVQGPFGQVDGIIQIDPVGLQPLLRLAGPLTVPPWPVPISADTVSNIAHHEAYVRFESDNDQRIAFLGSLVENVFGRALRSGTGEINAGVIEGFSRAVSGGHIQMHAQRPQEQRQLERLGLAGGVARESGATDVLGLVSDNAVGNKIDWFLRRDVRYEATLDPQSGTAKTRLDATLTNEAPSSGLPDYVIGSPLPEIAKGVSRQILVLLRSEQAAPPRIRLAGRRYIPRAGREARLRNFHVRRLDIAPKGRVRLLATSEVPRAVRGSGRHRVYRLHVLRQPVAHPDTYHVRVRGPRGWRVTGESSFDGPLESDLVMDVRMVQTRRAWLVDRLILEPASWLRDTTAGLLD